MAVSWERRWRRTGGRDDPRLRDRHRSRKLETALGPWIRWPLAWLALATLLLRGRGGDGGEGGTCAIWGLRWGLAIRASTLCGLCDAWLDAVDGRGRATAAIQPATQEGIRGRSIVDSGSAGGHGMKVEERRMETHLS